MNPLWTNLSVLKSTAIILRSYRQKQLRKEHNKEEIWVLTILTFKQLGEQHERSSPADLRSVLV